MGQFKAFDLSALPATSLTPWVGAIPTHDGTGTGGVNGSRVTYIPVHLAAGRYDALAAKVTTGAADIVAALGVYSERNGLPHAKLAETGELDVSSVGVITDAIDLVWDGGWAFLAFNCSGVGPAMSLITKALAMHTAAADGAKLGGFREVRSPVTLPAVANATEIASVVDVRIKLA